MLLPALFAFSAHAEATIPTESQIIVQFRASSCTALRVLVETWSLSDNPWAPKEAAELFQNYRRNWIQSLVRICDGSVPISVGVVQEDGLDRAALANPPEKPTSIVLNQDYFEKYSMPAEEVWIRLATHEAGHFAVPFAQLHEHGNLDQIGLAVAGLSSHLEADKQNREVVPIDTIERYILKALKRGKLLLPLNEDADFSAFKFRLYEKLSNLNFQRNAGFDSVMENLKYINKEFNGSPHALAGNFFILVNPFEVQNVKLLYAPEVEAK